MSTQAQLLTKAAEIDENRLMIDALLRAGSLVSDRLAELLRLAGKRTMSQVELASRLSEHVSNSDELLSASDQLKGSTHVRLYRSCHFIECLDSCQDCFS